MKKQVAVAKVPAKVTSIAKQAQTEYKRPKSLFFKGDGAQHVGFEEPNWFEHQPEFGFKRDVLIMHAFNWYTQTQEDRVYFDLMIEALKLMPKRQALVKMLDKATTKPNKTAKLYCRMAAMGLNLYFHEKRHIALQIRESLKSLPKTVSASKTDAVVNTEEPNIQDRINAKLKLVFGEFEVAFDDFITKGKFASKNEASNIIHKLTPPANRSKDLIAMSERYSIELQNVLKGKDLDLVEGYSAYGKRELKAMLNWWTETIYAINSYSIHKKQNRKPRKRKAVAPEKVVSKLKYLREFPELNLTSVRPVEILRSSEMWSYDTKTRKLSLYIADQSSSTLDVKNSRILNLDPIKSVQKTLRKPEEQLKQFLALGKPAAHKFFNAIKGVESKVKEITNDRSVILKVSK